MYKIAFGKISALFNAISSVEKLYVPTDKDDIAVLPNIGTALSLLKNLTLTARLKIFSSHRQKIFTM